MCGVDCASHKWAPVARDTERGRDDEGNESVPERHVTAALMMALVFAGCKSAGQGERSRSRAGQAAGRGDGRRAAGGCDGQGRQHDHHRRAAAGSRADHAAGDGDEEHDDAHDDFYNRLRPSATGQPVVGPTVRRVRNMRLRIRLRRVTGQRLQQRRRMTATCRRRRMRR